MLLAVIAATLITCAVAAQRLEPTTYNDQTGTYTFTISGLPALTKGKFQQDPFYNVFRIYGNGEYAPYIRRNADIWENYNNPIRVCCNGRNQLCENLNCTVSSHTDAYSYPGNIGLTYQHMALILPRKGDVPPPDPLRGTVTPPRASPNPTPREVTIPPCKKIYLTHSHGYLHAHKQENNRVGEKSVFIISYKPDSCLLSQGARIYLFYGSKKDNRAINNPEQASQHFLNTNMAPQFIPVYLPGASPVQWTNLSRQWQGGIFSNYEVFDLPSGYVANVANAIGDSAEQRLFREVEYDANGALESGESSYVLAVLTIDSLCGYGNQLVDFDIPPGVLNYDKARGMLDGRKIVDSDGIYLKIGEPDDPNKLEVKNMCADGTVRLRLEFCNDSFANAIASGAQVTFRILNNNFKWCAAAPQVYYPGYKVREVSKYSSKHLKTSLDCYAITQLVDRNSASYNCTTKTFRINGLLKPEECGEIDVFLKYNGDITIDALNKMVIDLQNAPVLEASVWLCDNPNPLVIQNEKVPLEAANISGEFFNEIPAIVKQCQKQCETCRFRWWRLRDWNKQKDGKKCRLFSGSFWHFGTRKKQ